MIGRIITLSLASAFTTVAVAGILLVIALDMLGEEMLLKFWRPQPTPRTEVVSITGLEGARDITFFVEAPVSGSPLTVHTGTRFSTVGDLLTKKQESRWCYVLLPARGGMPRQLKLAEQNGKAAPTFSDLSVYPESEFAQLGVDASSLAAIARTHCRFAEPSDEGGAA
jgi:hypothetical protein